METIVDVRRSARRPAASRRLHERLEKRLARLTEYEKRRWDAEPSATEAIAATRRELDRIEFARQTGWRAIDPAALMLVPTVEVAPGARLARVVCQSLRTPYVEAWSTGTAEVDYSGSYVELPGAWDGESPFRYRSHLPTPMPARVRRLAKEIKEQRLCVLYEATWVESPALDPILCVYKHDLLWVVDAWETSEIERWLVTEWSE